MLLLLLLLVVVGAAGLFDGLIVRAAYHAACVAEGIFNRIAQAVVERDDGDCRDERNDERVLDHALTFLRSLELLNQLVDILDHDYLLQTKFIAESFLARSFVSTVVF